MDGKQPGIGFSPARVKYTIALVDPAMADALPFWSRPQSPDSGCGSPMGTKRIGQ